MYLTIGNQAYVKWIFGFNILRKKLMKCYIRSIDFHGAESGIFQKIDQIHLERFEAGCWRRMEIILTSRVRNEEVLHKVKEETDVLLKIKRRTANWIGHILRRN
jgi:hypothetical protein